MFDRLNDDDFFIINEKMKNCVDVLENISHEFIFG
jgi:hypothetical protein